MGVKGVLGTGKGFRVPIKSLKFALSLVKMELV